MYVLKYISNIDENVIFLSTNKKIVQKEGYTLLSYEYTEMRETLDQDW